jgi:molybdopterin-guanine dinucleotide biosynthesis protein A
MEARRQQTTQTTLCHDVSVILPNVAAAIIAGGQARRFGGQDKSRLVVQGRPIIVRQLEVLERITPAIMVIANDTARFQDLAVPTYPDAIPGAGAIGGIYTALVRATTDHVVIVGCDLPFLHEGVLTRLITLADDADGAWVETARGPEPLLACYRTSAAAAIRDEIVQGHLRAADIGRVIRMAVLSEAELAHFGPVEHLLTNLNSPDDYARVQ